MILSDDEETDSEEQSIPIKNAENEKPPTPIEPVVKPTECNTSLFLKTFLFFFLNINQFL